jgi:pyruvate dehydrogenase E2 component (dihydrolipoamide acetyltransferase)
MAGPAAPSVRRFAREIGVALAAVPGSGPGGRISLEDVKAFARHARGGDDPGPAAAPGAEPPLPDFTRFGGTTREPMSAVRRTTAEHVSRAARLIPHVTHHDAADITGLERLRAAFGPRVTARGAKLTVTAVAVKVVAAALRRHPRFNASLDTARQEIVYKDFVHVGVAVDTEHGLLVPVIRDADRKNLVTIAVELADLSRRARARALTPLELTGATFTISNLGGVGGTGFTPLIDWPQVAILGLGRAAVAPVFTGGAFAPRTLLPLSLSYDHRVIDGADAARFTRWVAEALGEPFLVQLEG